MHHQRRRPDVAGRELTVKCTTVVGPVVMRVRGQGGIDEDEETPEREMSLMAETGGILIVNESGRASYLLSLPSIAWPRHCFLHRRRAARAVARRGEQICVRTTPLAIETVRLDLEGESPHRARRQLTSKAPAHGYGNVERHREEYLGRIGGYADMRSTSPATGRRTTTPGRRLERDLPFDSGPSESKAADGAFVPLAVSPRKAADYLDVGHDAIYQLLNQGRLRSVKLGRRRLIPMSELERFLTEEMA